MTDELETDPPAVPDVVEPPAEAVEEVVPHPDAPKEEHSHEHLCPECIAKVVDALAEANPVPPVEEVLDPDETPTKVPWTHRNPFGK